MSSQPIVPNQRFHHLDALRASALLLGIVFHAVLAYIPYFINPSIKWAVQDASTSHILGGLAFLNHVFRIEVFYLIAGFFAHLVYHRKGLRAFAKGRFVRIVAPFVVGWLVLYPLFMCLWVWGQQLCGLATLPESMQGWSPVKVTLAMLTQPGYVFFTRGITLTHLWFLWYLAILYVVTLGLRALVLRFAGAGEGLRHAADRSLVWLTTSKRGMLLLTAFVGSMLLGMRWWFGVDTPYRRPLPWALVPTPNSLGVYGVFFVTGWLLHRQPTLLDRIAAQWKPHVIVGLIATAAVGYFAITRYDNANPGVILAGVSVRIGYSLVYGLAMVTLVFGSVGLFVRFFPRESGLWRYIADSSYWLYIVHMPIVVWLQVVLHPFPLHWLLKLTLVLAVSTPVMLLTYHYCVRSTFIGLVLNGRRRPREPLSRLFRFKQGQDA